MRPSALVLGTPPSFSGSTRRIGVLVCRTGRPFCRDCLPRCFPGRRFSEPPLRLLCQHTTRARALVALAAPLHKTGAWVSTRSAQRCIGGIEILRLLSCAYTG